MRIFLFITGISFVLLVFYAFFHPPIVAWIVNHPILDWFIILLVVFFHYANTFLNDGPPLR